MSAPFELRNISEKKFPFFEKGRGGGGGGGGGGGRCVDTFDLFFLRGKSKLPHPWGLGGGGVGEVGGHLMEWP